MADIAIEPISDKIVLYLLILFLIAGTFLMYYAKGALWALFCFLLGSPFVFVAWYQKLEGNATGVLGTMNDFIDQHFEIFVTAYGVVMLVAVYISLEVSSSFPLYTSFALLMILSPVIFSLLFFVIIFAFSTPLDKLGLTDLEDFFTSFALGATVSFLVTYAAFIIGQLANPSALVPQTTQMLLVNVFLDGLTLALTFLILRWAMARPMRRIPVAILFDLLLGALLACGSLYLGVLGTDQSLSFVQVLRVLVALDPSDAGVTLGPYFWAMHTTFIPTLCYLGFIGVAWLGKVMLTPLDWFLARAGDHQNPLKYTAALLGILSVLSAASFWGFGELEKVKVKEEKAASAAQP